MSLVRRTFLNDALEIKVSAVAQARDSSLIKQGREFPISFFFRAISSGGLETLSCCSPCRGSALTGFLSMGPGRETEVPLGTQYLAQTFISGVRHLWSGALAVSTCQGHLRS